MKNVFNKTYSKSGDIVQKLIVGSHDGAESYFTEVFHTCRGVGGGFFS